MSTSPSSVQPRVILLTRYTLSSSSREGAGDKKKKKEPTTETALCMEMMLNTMTEVLTLAVADQAFTSAFLDMCQRLAMQGTVQVVLTTIILHTSFTTPKRVAEQGLALARAQYRAALQLHINNAPAHSIISSLLTLLRRQPSASLSMTVWCIPRRACHCCARASRHSPCRMACW